MWIFPWMKAWMLMTVHYWRARRLYLPADRHWHRYHVYREQLGLPARPRPRANNFELPKRQGQNGARKRADRERHRAANGRDHHAG